jgi:hypothetical protein
MRKVYQLPPGWSDYIQSLGFITQSCHFAWGGLIVMVAGLWLPWWGAAILLAIYICFKEFAFDQFSWGENHGSPDYWDALWYAIGGALACILLWIQ